MKQDNKKVKTQMLNKMHPIYTTDRKLQSLQNSLCNYKILLFVRTHLVSATYDDK